MTEQREESKTIVEGFFPISFRIGTMYIPVFLAPTGERGTSNPPSPGYNKGED